MESQRFTVEVELASLIEKAEKRLEPGITFVIKELADAEVHGLSWYLKKKIVDDNLSADEVRDHIRVFKYARAFLKHGGKPTIVPEDKQQSRPDLMVEWVGHRFYVEVKKFRMQLDSTSLRPIEKIVGAVTGKMRQLIASEMNFVAMDNFDLGLEARRRSRCEGEQSLAMNHLDQALEDEEEPEGFTHNYIERAICEVEELTAKNPSCYERLSGAIFAVHTSGGASSDPSSLLPHLVWFNKRSCPPVPESLRNWIVGALPAGKELVLYKRTDPFSIFPEPE